MALQTEILTRVFFGIPWRSLLGISGSLKQFVLVWLHLLNIWMVFSTLLDGNLKPNQQLTWLSIATIFSSTWMFMGFSFEIYYCSGMEHLFPSQYSILQEYLCLTQCFRSNNVSATTNHVGFVSIHDFMLSGYFDCCFDVLQYACWYLFHSLTCLKVHRTF